MSRTRGDLPPRRASEHTKRRLAVAALHMSYCPSCYRDLPDGELCLACAERQIRTRPAARLPLRIGLLGLPFLVFGILGPSHHACFVGAILAGCGALAHVAATLKE